MRACLLTQLCPTLCNPMDCSLPGSSVRGDSPGKNTGVSCHALLQGIFPIQGSNPGLPHCRRFLYHLSHQGSSRILRWVAYPFSRGSSQCRNRTRVSCLVGGFFTAELSGKPQWLPARCQIDMPNFSFPFLNCCTISSASLSSPGLWWQTTLHNQEFHYKNEIS